MTNDQEEFLNLCPAWARQLGIKNLKQWKLVEDLRSYSMSTIYDILDTNLELSKEDKNVVKRVIIDWNER